MVLLNNKLKHLSCTDFRIFLKKLVKDKIEKEWSEKFVEDINLVLIPRMTIKRRYEKMEEFIVRKFTSTSCQRRWVDASAGTLFRTPARNTLPRPHAPCTPWLAPPPDVCVSADWKPVCSTSVSAPVFYTVYFGFLK